MAELRSGSFRYFTPWLVVLSLGWAGAVAVGFAHPAAVVAAHWELFFVGIAGGFVGNLTAIGGGVVFIPVLLLVYRVDPVSALKLSFVTQAVGMTSGASGWIQRGDVPLRALRWTAPSLFIGAGIATFVLHPSAALVKLVFGPVSILAGLATLVTLRRQSAERDIPAGARIPLFLVSIVGGLISGWVAIGEGEIVAASCMLGCGLSANRAIGLGVVLLSINSIFLGLLYTFVFGGVPWEMAAFTCLGVLWGGRLAPFLAQRISLRGIKIAFAAIAIVDGTLIAVQAARHAFG
jgi:uncharacterized membrane protein YfcA